MIEWSDMISKELVQEAYNVSMNDLINIDRLSKEQIKSAFKTLMGNVWICLNHEDAKRCGIKIGRADDD